MFVYIYGLIKIINWFQINKNFIQVKYDYYYFEFLDLSLEFIGLYNIIIKQNICIFKKNKYIYI